MLEEIFEDEFKALGTQIHIWVLFKPGEEEKIKKDIKKLKEFYFRKEKIFSRFDPESELNYFNQNLGKFVKASEDFVYLCQKSLEYCEFSDGFFDPRVIEVLESIGYDKDFKKIKPTDFYDSENFEKNNTNLNEDLKMKGDEVLFKKRMDFSGVAKGYITDEGVKFLKNHSFQNFILDSGGDMFASGLDNGEKWEIDLEGFSADKLKLQIQDMAVATSGITRRKWEAKGKKFHHLINPKNPSVFSFDLKSVSAVGSTTEEADVLAKILFLMGKTEGLKFANQKNIPAIFLDYRGNVFVSKKTERYLI
jgi:FAD:protein FMN transferase